MKSSEYIFEALEKINASREKALLIAENKKTQLYLNHPEIENYDKQIASVFQNVMKKMIAGEKADFKAAEEKSLSLQKQKAEYIKKNNVDISVTLPNFACEKCSDTGYFNGKICDCVRKMAVSINYDELNKDVKLDDYTFDKFLLDYYPETVEDGVNPRDIMTKICGFCVKYATEFNENSESLLFFGKTGLGKTHLSLSIANEVIKKGYNVVYGPISKIIGSIEREHFSGNDRTTLTNVLDCDLLIFDDLGTEFTTSFVSSAVFDIVNSRILKNKPTIINTNLDFEELKQKYSDRVVSRIAGSYRMLQFFGKDIRTIK
ncbi:MAG: ATP-binding protein [Clostridia bacterium]|nr:ATP-binding protein [Clostridia bacterium]